jgi:hypothetical protein
MSLTTLKSNIGGTFDSDHIYYNITILNSDNGNTRPPEVIFNEIRNSPYLSNPQDYYMSVVRFSLETPTLPVFIPQAQLGQTDPDKLIYSVTLSYQDAGSSVNYVQQTFLTWVPQNAYEPIPKPPIEFQDLTSNYYYCYSYQWFIDIVNRAFVTCFNALNAQVIAAGRTLPSANPPIMEWDIPAFRGILNCDASGYDLNTDIPLSPVKPIKVFFNVPLYNLFSSFEAIHNGYDNITFGRAYQIRVRNVNGLNFLLLPAGWTALQIYQEYATTPLWNPVQSLVFTTSLLPVVPELTSVPKVFGTDSKFFNVGNNSNITSVLTDFEVGLTTGAEYKPNVQYTPSAEYRLVDLFGNNPLSALEIRVYWKDSWGNLVPFTLNSGCTATVKLMFRKKNFGGKFYD